MILKPTMTNIVIIKLMMIKVLIIEKAVNRGKYFHFGFSIFRVVLIEAESKCFVQYLPPF